MDLQILGAKHRRWQTDGDQKSIIRGEVDGMVICNIMKLTTKGEN